MEKRDKPEAELVCNKLLVPIRPPTTMSITSQVVLIIRSLELRFNLELSNPLELHRCPVRPWVIVRGNDHNREIRSFLEEASPALRRN